MLLLKENNILDTAKEILEDKKPERSIRCLSAFWARIQLLALRDSGEIGSLCRQKLREIHAELVVHTMKQLFALLNRPV